MKYQWIEVCITDNFSEVGLEWRHVYPMCGA